MASKWNMKPLEEVAQIVMGYSPKGETYNSEGEGTPLLNGPTEFGPHSPRVTLFTTDPIRFSEPGDILFCVRGSTGRMNWSDKKYAVGRGIAAIRAKTNGADTYFIYCCIREYMQRLLSLTSGSVFPNLSAGDINGFEIPWPEKPTRGSIAHVLGTLDDKIELNRRMNQTLEKMAAAIFKSWFIDFDPVHAKAQGRDPNLPPEIADLFPDSFENSALGPIPKRWTPGKLGDVVEILDSKRIPLSSAERAQRKGPYPYYGAAGVLDHVDDFLFSGTHVLMGEDGSVVTDYDKPVVQYVWNLFWVNNHAHVLRGKNGFTEEHLYLFLKQLNIRPYVTGAVQPKLNQRNMKSVPMVVPPKAVSEAFGRVVGPLFQKFRANADEGRTLAGLRDTLLPKLLSGEIELPEAEAVAEGVK